MFMQQIQNSYSENQNVLAFSGDSTGRNAYNLGSEIDAEFNSVGSSKAYNLDLNVNRNYNYYRLSPISDITGMGSEITVKGDADDDGDLDRGDVNLRKWYSPSNYLPLNHPLDLNGDRLVTGKDIRIADELFRQNTDFTRPEIQASLVNDSLLSGNVTDDSQVTRLFATFDNNDIPVNITDKLNTDGSFELNSFDLQQLNKGIPINGDITIYLKSKDQWGNVGNAEFTFDYKQPLDGDADGDWDVDTDDLNEIISSDHTRVNPGDSRDLDGNGRINKRDGKKLFNILWRNTDYEHPEIEVGLLNDTAYDSGSNIDNITSDPSISGVITDESQITKFWASLDNQNFTDVTNTLEQDGQFVFNRALMEQINGGPLVDGTQTLHLLTKDQWGNEGHLDFDFEINRVIYVISSEDSQELALINTETDDLIKVPLNDIEGWQEVESELRSTDIRYFQSQLTPDQVYIPEGLPSPIGSGANGIMNIVLDPTGTAFGKEGAAVQYTLKLFGVDLGGTSTATTSDDVTAIHLHSGNPGAERIGPHVLNMFGMPGVDDDDIVFDFENNTITGIWDNSDSLNSVNTGNTSNGTPDHHLSDVVGVDPLTTKTVSAYADELLAGNLYIQVHTNEFNIPGGVMRGQVEEIAGDGSYQASTEGYIESAFVEHTLITPDEKSLYVTVNGSLQMANAIVALDVNSVDWETGEADLTVANSFKTAEAGEATVYPEGLFPVDENSQPIQAWPAQAWNQVHGPSIQPMSNIVQFSQWSNDRLFFINDDTKELVEDFDPLVIDNVTQQVHGLFYNSSNNIALSPSYYWDGYGIHMYDINPDNTVNYEDTITVSSDEGNGAFFHYVTWIDNRYAYTASMQYGETSLTPEGVDIVGPSIWLLDTQEKTAERVVATADTANDTGVFRNPSDLIVVGNKLYVAEEDSLDATFGDDGYIAVYDISDKDNPEFIKRLKPGEDLPADFKIAHGLSPSADGSSVYAASYLSEYVIKIDTETDTVTKVYGSEDGLTTPHGGFAAGAYR